MSSTICRTCLTVLRENSHTFFTLENGVPGTTTFREKLICCIPELALDIIPNAVICTTCSATLNLAYDFKTKCLEVETKVRKYLECFTEGYEIDCVNYLSCTPSVADSKPSVVNKSQHVSAMQEKILADFTRINRGENLKPELDCEDNAYCVEVKQNPFAKTGDGHTDIKNDRQYETCSVVRNIYTKHNSNQHQINTRSCKIKSQSDSNEEVKELNVTHSSKDKVKVETQKELQHNFVKALQTLGGNNVNKSLSELEQAFEQFNLLKVVRTLADQGTEININGLGNLPKQKKSYERYDCYYCSRSFDRLSLLKTHTISHTGVKPFTCNVCGKGCSHKGELNNHMRTHTGEKPFKCSVCESSFSQISNMKIHMRTHTGEKPYKCDYCEKTFSHKCGVKVHMRTHTGERPYKCEICCKTYTHKKDLDDHMRTHTGEKYRCTICLKEITYKKNLNAHMITHSMKNGGKQGTLKRSYMVKCYSNLAH